MLTEQRLHYGYGIIAEARGHQVLFYQIYGDYEGTWLMLSRGRVLAGFQPAQERAEALPEHYFLWRGSYGSCSGCDDLEACLSGGTLYTSDPAVQEFISKYEPFAEMEPSSALRLAQAGDILKVLPANEREWSSDVPWEEVAKQIGLIIRAEQGAASSEEILQVNNSEARRRAVEHIGHEAFVTSLPFEVQDEDRDRGNRLLRLHREDEEDYVCLDLQDASTPRRFIHRVPPQVTTVRGGLAWSANVPEEEYQLDEEA